MGTKYRDGVEYHGAFPAQVIQSLITDICDMVYPVGCYFETTDTDFDPNEVFVGTWVLEAEGLVHISSGTNYVVSANDKDGGEATHILTVQEMPAHGHGWQGVNTGTTVTSQVGNYPFTINQDKRYNWDGTASMIKNTGGGQAHNNMPPYKIVNRWYRTE